MTGRKMLGRVQLGKEGTPGTVVTATTRWRGPATWLSDGREVAMVGADEAIGLIGGSDRSVLVAVDAALALPETGATPEQLAYLLAMGLGGPVTGSADGSGGTGFVYATSIPTTAAPTNTAYSVEVGDDFEVEVAGYTKATKIVLKGSPKGQVTVQADLIAQSVARLGSAFTSTTIPAVSDLVFGRSRLYLDAIGGTIGTTQITNEFMGFEITIEPMWEKKFTGEGAASPVWSHVVYVGHKISGKIILEHAATAGGASGLKSFFRAQTPRLMRVDILGDAYGTAGTGTLLDGQKGIRIDLPIKVSEGPEGSDQNGNNLITIPFESRYNATVATAGSITVANELAALP